jgi:hypothetical protein
VQHFLLRKEQKWVVFPLVSAGNGTRVIGTTGVGALVGIVPVVDRSKVSNPYTIVIVLVQCSDKREDMFTPKEEMI